jgi:hypothetical protein
MRLEGNALVSAMRDELEKLRCSACGQLFTAAVPAAAGTEEYTARARAVLALARYYLGLPWYRLEGFPALAGVPVPEATQGEQGEIGGDCSYPIFRQLEQEAAQGGVIFQDETPGRVVTWSKENQRVRATARAQGKPKPDERAGMQTTALMVQVGDRRICLYYTGRQHAGENLEARLTKRAPGRDQPLVMSDALSRNKAEEERLIRCPCLAHGRRQFSDVADDFPAESAVVIDALKLSYGHDDEAREQELTAQERLAYHQTYSAPVFTTLHPWLEEQTAQRLVEPNRSLGPALAYLLGHWETLTRGITVAGAPSTIIALSGLCNWRFASARTRCSMRPSIVPTSRVSSPV